MFGCNISDMGGSKVAQDRGVDPETAVVQTANTRTLRRGRICLVDYKYSEHENKGSGIIEMPMYLPPNMYPPAFLFMNLTTQGTKTKMLGHDAERGGWSVPCAANEFRSGHDNFPWALGSNADVLEYSVDQVRNMPMLMNIGRADYALDAAKNGADAIYYQDDNPQICLFDPVCRNPEGVALNFAGVTALCEDDYSLVINLGAPVPAAGWTDQFKFGSRMIHYGDTVRQTAVSWAPPRKKFGDGHVASSSPTFTVSMITPMWIYTDVPNSTVQTLDVQLMWGDTAKNVDDATAEPCQLSLIASQ
jgi:hypothetical protein